VKILIADSLSPEGIEILRSQSDCQVEVREDIDPATLRSIIGEYDALIVRSRTQVTADIIRAGRKLRLIGRAGVGVDNVDVPEATRRGIIVLNAPEGNTLSTCELTMGMMLALARKIPSAVASTRQGKWEKKQFAGCELHGKTLGIVGLGRIGREVARRAAAFGMSVLAADPFCTPDMAKRAEVKLVPLEQVLREADFITIHAPLTDDTRGMIGPQQFNLMKDGVYLINCARGGIVDEAALVAALQSGKVAGCALDVFEKEPPGDHPLLEFDQVIATPHVGASTSEAQASVAVEIARRVLDALRGGPIYTAVNMPRLDPQLLQAIGPYISLAEKMGRLVAQMADGPVSSLMVTYTGEMTQHDVAPITAALTKGLLTPALGDEVNAISAPAIAAERGIAIIEAKSDQVSEFSNFIAVEARCDTRPLQLGATLFSRGEARIVRINGYHVDVVPEGHLLICTNQDKPGAIRHLSSVLAEDGINIGSMTVGRDRPGGTAVTVVNIDQPPSPQALLRIRSYPIILDARLVQL
jgi:D-3-phosphoglycerate dehydrogenase